MTSLIPTPCVDLVGGPGFMDEDEGEGEEEEMDPSILQDPIYQADLQMFLKEFFQQAYGQTERIQQVTSQLSKDDLDLLKKALEA